eukprot:Lithocolla_globosa_v1_NODE_1746_length_2364_cov_123.437419.p1 type:complete len:371 gc:universal NODE_1746_length_2364_cov_123.437419:1494-382(-)
MDNDVSNAVVIDHGSFSCKVGFAAESKPRAYIPSVVGNVFPTVMAGMLHKDCFVGEEALNKRGILRIRRPIERGRIVDWDSMEKLWYHCFYNELRTDPVESPIMLIEAPETLSSETEKMVEIMFDWNVPMVCVGQPLALSLATSGMSSGVVLDIGESSRTMVIRDGIPQMETFQKVDIGGGDLTSHMSRLVTRRGYSGFDRPGGLEMSQDIKEKLGQVCGSPSDLDASIASKLSDSTYELPDGNVLSLTSQETHACPEALFHPPLLGMEEEGVPQLVQKSLSVNPSEDLYQHVVLSGGSTLFPGFPERLQKELTALSGETVKLWAPKHRLYSAWLGGALVASLPPPSTRWVTKGEFEEAGPHIVHTKCAP